MAGKLCPDGDLGFTITGIIARQRTDRNPRAYCEGRQGRASGLLVGDNPHVATSEEFEHWDAGWKDKDGDIAVPGTSPASGTCCAL